jgi:uncharacterized phage protein gp47/JayE
MIQIPTIAQLSASIKATLETNFGLTIPSTGKNFLRALIAMQAAKLKLLYLVIGNTQKNIWPDTADSESIGGTLERFGRTKLNRNPKPAVAGQYELTITGSIGAIIKAATTWKSNDENTNPGYLFILDSEYTLVSETDTITVRALTPGETSKLFVLDNLQSTTPIALVNKAAYVSSIVVEPLAAETIEAYRTAILNSFRLEAQGGAATDFRIWSADAQGVAVVYPYAKSGESGVVNLFVEATIADSIDGKGTPSNSILSAVEDVIEFNPDETLDLNERGRRPLGVFQVNYLPVEVKEIDIIINDFQGLTVDIQALLLSAITSTINSIRPFVSAADVLANKNDILDNNKIINAILTQQPGSVFGTIEIYVSGILVSSFTFLDGDIPHLNSVSYA